MKFVRFPIQILSILLQLYFWIETIRLYTQGYVLFLGDPVENGWFALLTTLIIVIVCEFISFLEAMMFVVSTRSIVSAHSIYSYIYLALVIINAIFFSTMIYYSSIGTYIGLTFYLILFVIRILNCIQNFVGMFKKRAPKIDGPNYQKV